MSKDSNQSSWYGRHHNLTRFMKTCGRLFFFGFLSWLITFGGAMCLSPLRIAHRTMFETMIGVVLTISTVLFTLLYFRRVQAAFVREGLLLGVAFVACNILFDLPMFLSGPMQMPSGDYMRDIGLAYLSMPVVSVGFGYALQREHQNRRFA
jgi:hypothetical protein